MNSFREKLGKQRRSKRLEIENCFAVKYLGCTTKLEKDIAVVEEAVNQLTNKVLNKEKGNRVSGKFFLRITEKRISLFPKAKKNQGSEVFSVAIEKISYGYFPPIRNYHILALNSHASNCEVETYVMCCETREDMFAIKLAFYSAFKGRYFARLRIKRKKNSILSNQLYSSDEAHSQLKSTENRPKNARDEPLAISNEELNDCPKDEKKNDLENQAVVDIHYQKQRRRQEKSAGTQNNGDSGRTACPARNTRPTNKDLSLIMYNDLTSSRC